MTKYHPSIELAPGDTVFFDNTMVHINERVDDDMFHVAVDGVNEERHIDWFAVEQRKADRVVVVR